MSHRLHINASPFSKSVERNIPPKTVPNFLEQFRSTCKCDPNTRYRMCAGMSSHMTLGTSHKICTQDRTMHFSSQTVAKESCDDHTIIQQLVWKSVVRLLYTICNSFCNNLRHVINQQTLLSKMISLLMPSVGMEHMEVLFPVTVKKILKHFLIKHMSTLFYYSILHHFHLQPHSNQQQIRLSKNIKLLYLFCMTIIRDVECKYQEQNIQHVIIMWP